MFIRLAKLKPKIRKPFLELFGQPRACGKAANEKRELFGINHEQCSRMTEYTDRIGRKASLEVISDRIYGRINRGFEEPRNLCAVCK